MAPTLKPLTDRVIIKPASQEEVTKSGIVLPDTARGDRPERGEVLAIGPGKVLENGQRQAMSIKVGDTVVFTKYAPNEVKIDGEEVLIIREDDIMAVVEK
ncbi:MAG TPA: co-chaperone GroES [Patescibacteria group bacterium]|nr:co-chaperone GroES [Patescibacteria group bacterium]